MIIVLDLDLINDVVPSLGEGLINIQVLAFDRDRFFQNAEIRGFLGIMLGSQANQLLLVNRQLELAERVEELIAQELTK